MNHPKTPSRRIERAKSILTPKRSTEAVRNGLRNEFFAKLRTSRSNSFDKIRQVMEQCVNETPQNVIKELRDAIFASGEADILNSEEIIAFFEIVQQEIANEEIDNQASQYEQIFKQEIEDMVERHLTSNCQGCGKLSIKQYFCDECLKEFSMDMNN